MGLDSKIPAGPLADKWKNHKDHMELVAPNNRDKIDIIVVGTGLAGGSAAALAEQGYNVKAFAIKILQEELSIAAQEVLMQKIIRTMVTLSIVCSMILLKVVTTCKKANVYVC
jgi:hypothetical protein